MCASDLKMENMMLGIGSHASSFPSSRSLWSKNQSKSKQHVPRTVENLKEDLVKKQSTRATAMECHNVQVEPVNFVVFHPHSSNFRRIFAPAPLHGITLSVNKFMGYFQSLAPEHFGLWLTSSAVQPNVRRGKSSQTQFQGGCMS